MSNQEENALTTVEPNGVAKVTLPWERLPEETASAYVAFCAYRDMESNRTLDSAWSKHTGRTGAVAPGSWRRYSSNFKWVDRATAYDRWRAATQYTSAIDLVNNEIRDANLQIVVDSIRRYREDMDRRLRVMGILYAKIAQHFNEYGIEAGALKPNEAAQLARALASLSDSINNSQALLVGFDQRPVVDNGS